VATSSHQSVDDSEQFIDLCIDAAQNRIAPTWPLDQFIAVNPYWGWRDQDFPEVAKNLWKLAGAPLTMPPDYFLAQWRSGQFCVQDIDAAMAYADQPCSMSALQDRLHSAHSEPEQALLITRLTDQYRDLSHALSWQQFVKHQISQHCAAYFDQGQAAWHPCQSSTLYASWQSNATFDQGPLLQLGYRRFKQAVRQLPTDATELIQTVLPQLGLDRQQWRDYLSALLMDINGWAAWCSYIKWQAQLGSQSSQQRGDQIVQLLAVRLAWEWLLLQQYPSMREQLVAAWRGLAQHEAALEKQCELDHVLLHAMEHAGQKTLATDLLQVTGAEPRVAACQAVFCIDVRSEVYRRALEAHHPAVATIGFAGFFGLPIAYRERGSALIQPHLPGLLAPRYWVSEPPSDADLSNRRTLRDQNRWQALRQNASSTFSFVETLGLLYGAELLRGTLRKKLPQADPQEAPALMLYADSALSQVVSLAEQVALVKQILIAMGLRQNLSPLVLLAGHGASCANNPHASGLECGACGGQSGAINVRLLADMLNNPALRAGLLAEHIIIPDSTWFIAGLHNTTTDDLQLYHVDRVPQTHLADLAQLQAALAAASAQARAERAASLGMNSGAAGKENLADSYIGRSVDWAQIRPEWGLANNAAMIVAPRSRSRGLNLGGRAFLHDYDSHSDAGYAILELIMTAPMVVANWINMQYYASTVDPQRYGSGSKILHNVVGQRLGVFEGNGGDLRIGLPWQSVHDGKRLMHTPLRLSVMIEAPREAILAILEKHATVRNLVDHQWLHLFQIDATENKIYYRNRQQWTAFA